MLKRTTMFALAAAVAIAAAAVVPTAASARGHGGGHHGGGHHGGHHAAHHAGGHHAGGHHAWSRHGGRRFAHGSHFHRWTRHGFRHYGHFARHFYHGHYRWAGGWHWRARYGWSTWRARYRGPYYYAGGAPCLVKRYLPNGAVAYVHRCVREEAALPYWAR